MYLWGLSRQLEGHEEVPSSTGTQRGQTVVETKVVESIFLLHDMALGWPHLWNLIPIQQPLRL